VLGIAPLGSFLKVVYLHAWAPRSLIGLNVWKALVHLELQSVLRISEGSEWYNPHLASVHIERLLELWCEVLNRLALQHLELWLLALSIEHLLELLLRLLLLIWSWSPCLLLQLLLLLLELLLIHEAPLAGGVAHILLKI
jgi:hypothetical protein